MVANKAISRDVQRIFLQAVMSRRMLSVTVATTLWKKCCEAVRAAGAEVPDNYSSEAWNAFISSVNQCIEPFALEFRCLVDESSGSKLYALINRDGDEVAQLATDYTPQEIAYFRAVVEQIMIAPNYVFSIASKAALREVTHLKSNMTKVQAEGVLTSLVKRGWLLKSKRGRYSLAVRALIELDAYLRQNFEEDCLVCAICEGLVTKGKMCYNVGCNAATHNHCYEGHRKGKKPLECRECKASWADVGDMKIIGEEAARDGLDDKRRIRRRARVDDDNEGVDDSQDIDATQIPTQTQSSQQPTQTQRGKGKNVEAKRGKNKRREETPELEEDVEGMNIDDENEMAEPTQTQTQRRSRNRRG